MGGFACSSWYYLRFTSPHYTDGPFEPEAMRYWMPPDLYVGGAEHAVLHLLYSRFWTKVMADAGLVPFREPFPRLMNQGVLHGIDGARMSKSKGNSVTPDEVVAAYGADALRLHVMFMAPFDQDVIWTEEGINGVRRFLNKVWTLYAETYPESKAASGTDDELEHLLHRTIQDTTKRIAEFRYNTMVSGLMEFANALDERRRAGTWHTTTYHQALETLLVILAPAAPYISEEIWHQTGHQGSVHNQTWPTWDAELAQVETITIPVQVNGKVRELVKLGVDSSEEDVRAQALALPGVQRFINGKQVKRVIYVPGKVLNVVVK
jgi:leucyl-tRNA synthetase